MGKELTFKDRDGVAYQPVRNHNRATGRSAFRVKPKGASNRTDEALECETIQAVAKAMLIDGLAARVQPVAGGPVNYVRFGADKLISYELDKNIAERLGIPARGNKMTDTIGTDDQSGEDILVHFDFNEKFKKARQHWKDDQKKAFISFAKAIHDLGLDWYFVRIDPFQLRYGNRPVGKRANSVVGIVNGQSPQMFIRKEAAATLKPKGRNVLPVDASLLDWATRHREVLAKYASKDRTAGLWPDAYDPNEAQDELEMEHEDGADVTTNLILYGPPGTGKTYRTAQEAVRLCGLEPPADREELMQLYRELSEAGRIEFVTFHQSMAYEEFVEGLRPSSTDEDGEPLAGGFTLVPTPGIFRRIAKRAETSTAPGDKHFSIEGRKVFKMSLGDVTNPDDAYLFEEAIEGGHVILGFNDIDWSDPKFEKRDAIKAACQAVAPDDVEITAQSAVVQMPHIFRNWMREGDVVIVSKGKKFFRAIGVITGGYRYAPREDGDYCHQRNVKWLWWDHDGVPVEEIYARGFSMRTTYEMFSGDLNIPALERYANSGREGAGKPEPFVLGECHEFRVRGGG